MIRPSLLASALAAFVCLSASAPVGHAQPAQHKQPTQKAIDEARKHFQSAEAAKARGEYQTAAVEYLAAYELFEEPAFFYDTAEVYRLAGDEKNALVYYTKYLELSPNGQGATAARTAADQLRRSIAGKEDAARRAAEDEARHKADDAKRKADDAKRKTDQDTGRKTDDAGRKADQAATRKLADDAKRKTGDGAQRKADQPATRTASTTDRPTGATSTSATATGAGRGMRIAGMAAGGAGVVALGVGVVFGLKAQSLSNEAAAWTTFDQKRYDEGKADDRNMLVLTGVGAAALVAGGVLYYLGHRAEQATDTGALTIAPGIGASAVTLTAAGRF
jgi:tetratricopeptide (TPR) repeat protein